MTSFGLDTSPEGTADHCSQHGINGKVPTREVLVEGERRHRGEHSSGHAGVTADEDVEIGGRDPIAGETAKPDSVGDDPQSITRADSAQTSISRFAADGEIPRATSGAGQDQSHIGGSVRLVLTGPDCGVW